jgi:hypothetical protein
VSDPNDSASAADRKPQVLSPRIIAKHRAWAACLLRGEARRHDKWRFHDLSTVVARLHELGTPLPLWSAVSGLGRTTCPVCKRKKLLVLDLRDGRAYFRCDEGCAFAAIEKALGLDGVEVRRGAAVPA